MLVSSGPDGIELSILIRLLMNHLHTCSEGETGCYSIYGFEYATGDNGYITWVSNDKSAWTIRAGAMAANSVSEVGARQIPDEPMYLIMNLGISENFGAVE